ncbi:Kinesin-like protein KIN-5D, partial [Camellia lanceoleosa]
MDNSKAHQQKKEFNPLSLCNTLWSRDKSSKIRDHLMMEAQSRLIKITVSTCRPLSEDEKRAKMPVAISCNEHKREVSVIQNAANKHLDKSFVFDKVFSPKSQQKDLYEQAIAPIVNEALEGYNCTIFAYGETGRKTYTMEGEGRKQKVFFFFHHCHVFNRNNDLLVPDEVSKSLDDKSKPIALMEDGKGGGFVRGLEERVVRTADEIYKILEEGSGMKHTADTLLNKQSNRSHSIFSITIHTKECNIEIELIKCGKLNLVDLAGAENILRSGARELGECCVGMLMQRERRGSWEINKSLLTLGVINALVATISPSIHCLEETISTLDYAYRAKTIKNRPEVSKSKGDKVELIKDLYRDRHALSKLRATREKNGIYIPRDHYMNEEAAKKYVDKFICAATNGASGLYINQQQLVEELKAMTEKALELHAELGMQHQRYQLAADIDRKSKVEDRNRILIQNFRAQLDQQLEVLHETVAASVTEQQQQLKVIEEDTQLFVSTKATVKYKLFANTWRFGTHTVLLITARRLKSMYGSSIKHLDDLAGELDGKSQLAFDNLSLEISNHSTSLMNLFKNIASEADPLINKLQNNLNNQEEMIAVFAQQQHEVSQGYAVNEERQLLDKVAKMLATSTARKIKLVGNSTNSVQEEWETYMQKIDIKYIEDSTVVESVNDGLEEGLEHWQIWFAEHWRNAKDSLLSLRTRNVDSMNSIWSVLQFSSVALSTMEKAITTNKSFLSSIE